jgi:hypothetical protein
VQEGGSGMVVPGGRIPQTAVCGLDALRQHDRLRCWSPSQLLLLRREDHGEAHNFLPVELQWWLNHLAMSLGLRDLVRGVANEFGVIA